MEVICFLNLLDYFLQLLGPPASFLYLILMILLALIMGQGVLGKSLMNSLSSTLYPVGTFISMLSITLIGLTLLADISWLKFIEFVGSSTLKFFEFFLKYLTTLYQRIKSS